MKTTTGYALATALLWAAGPVPLSADPPPADTPLARLLLHVEQDAGYPRPLRDFVRKSWAECEGCHHEEFFTQALSVISEDFRDALDAYDADGYARCAELMARLRESPNPFIAANAAVYEIKALIGAQHFKAALEKVEALAAGSAERIRTHTYMAAEVDFLRGYCLLSDMQFDAASEALQKFLEDHPDAPIRLRVSADQMLAEMDNRREGRLGEVTDLMNFSARRLSEGDTGDEVQQRQRRIVDLLDKLVEEAEQREQNSQSGGGGGSRNQPAPAPGDPMPQSSLPQGGQAEPGPLRPARSANPAEAWGNMPPAERERIMQALKESFPPRYRALIEQYYEDLAKRP